MNDKVSETWNFYSVLTRQMAQENSVLGYRCILVSRGSMSMGYYCLLVRGCAVAVRYCCVVLMDCAVKMEYCNLVAALVG
jgi:hypothetical protein